jgi:hypothetical protein
MTWLDHGVRPGKNEALVPIAKPANQERWCRALAFDLEYLRLQIGLTDAVRFDDQMVPRVSTHLQPPLLIPRVTYRDNSR